jgi:hypothetical protein
VNVDLMSSTPRADTLAPCKSILSWDPGLRFCYDRFVWEVAVAYTYHDLKVKTIQELRDIAKGVQHDAVQGYSQMNKDHLLPALCQALGIPTHEHHDVKGIDKPAIKAKMHDLKKAREIALAGHDHAALKNVRRQMHRLNRQIRAHEA